MAASDNSNYDVLVAGGGPAGLVLAIELGRRGINVLVVDQKESTAFNPQANATQARTMEHYRRLGFAEDIRELGLPSDHPTDIAYFTRLTHREIARFRLPTSQRTGLSVFETESCNLDNINKAMPQMKARRGGLSDFVVNPELTSFDRAAGFQWLEAKER